MSFGRYGKNDKVTHKSVGGNLQPVKKGETGSSDTPKSSSKSTSASSKEKDTSKSFGIGGKSSITLGDLDGSDKDLQNLIKKSGLKMKSKEGEQGDDITLSGNSKDIEKVLSTMYGDDWKDMYQKKGGEYVEKEETLDDYKTSKAYELLALNVSAADGDDLMNTGNYNQNKFRNNFDTLKSNLKKYGDDETVSLMNKLEDAVDNDNYDAYPTLKQDLSYALKGEKNPVYDQLKKTDDTSKVYNQQKYSTGDIESFAKDSSVMINQLDKLLNLSVVEPMTRTTIARSVRNDAVERIAQASEKMVSNLRSVAKGVKDKDEITILAHLEQNIKDLQPDRGIHQNYFLSKRVKDDFSKIKDYTRMLKRARSGSLTDEDKQRLKEIEGRVVTGPKKVKKITMNYFKEEANKFEERRLYVESITGLKNKAEKSGMPYSILKQVYDRGMAAWKSGHRPGASQQQWAFARVNSFITKSSGTWGGADKDLAAKVKGEK
jgi:hypothetical protein